MRFQTTLQKEPKHTELVSCIGWTSAEEVFSAADDHQILKWNLVNYESSVLTKLPDDVFPTDMHWLPKATAGAKKQAGSDLFALGTTDGKFFLYQRGGRVEKNVEAHRGAILALRWNQAGSDLMTAGEDGIVKLWSRNGMLRSTLAQTSSPVYSVAWSVDGQQVLYTTGKYLVIKSIQPNATGKPTTWKAHEGIVLKVDWNFVNNLIISGGEDNKYKVWDSYGRQVYSSSAYDYPVTALAWSMDGELFAVGSHNTLRLCDKAGWSYSMEKPNTGSVFSLAWSTDGTQVAAACGNGQVLFAHVIEKMLAWKNFEIVVSGPKTISVRNVLNDAREKLEFRDRIIKLSMGFSQMVVATSLQCYVYQAKNWNTPIIFELKEGNVTLVAQSEKYFLLVDGSSVYVYTYDGRLVCTPKFTGMRGDIMTGEAIALSDDTIAIRDSMDEKTMHLFDTATGKPVGDGKPIQNKVEVAIVSLDQCGTTNERRLAYVDKNRDLFLTQVRVYGMQRKTVKLGTMVDCICWNDESNMMVAIGNGKLQVWYYPNAAFVDRDALPKTMFEKEAREFGKNPQIVSFLGKHITIRRADGSIVSTTINPYPAVLHSYVAAGKWDDAVRLCRFVKEETLWACLATMAAYNRDMNTTAIAYAAIGVAEKVQFVQHIKELPLKECRTAEMMLLCGQIQDAEAVYLQAGLIFRAIFLNLELFNFDRAFDLAIKHKTHVDTVLGYRKRYLALFGKKETNKRFEQLATEFKSLDTDWDTVQAKVALELKKEKDPSTAPVTTGSSGGAAAEKKPSGSTLPTQQTTAQQQPPRKA